MNSLFQQLTKNQKSLPSQRNNNELFKKLLNSSNPNELLNNLIAENPNMKNLMQLMQSSGMTPKQFFYNYAQQNGINPDEFINSLKN